MNGWVATDGVSTRARPEHSSTATILPGNFTSIKLRLVEDVTKPEMEKMLWA
jgi:hypothetical protein